MASQPVTYDTQSASEPDPRRWLALAAIAYWEQMTGALFAGAPYHQPADPVDREDDELDSIVRYVDYAKHPDDRGGWSIGHVGPVPEGLVTWLIGMALLVAVCIAWTLAVGVLTDLGDNYRSRLLVDPLVVALVAVAVHRLVVAVRATAPRRNAEVLA